jgi:hypothetical protein
MVGEERKTTVLGKGPLVNRVIEKITQACFSSMDEVIDERVDDARVRKFIKGMTNLCENMIMDEFPTSRALKHAQEVKMSELPIATVETTSERTSSEQTQTTAFADSD